MPSNTKNTRTNLQSKLTELVNAEQEGIDILERFERADRLRAPEPRRRPDQIIGDARRRTSHQPGELRFREAS